MSRLDRIAEFMRKQQGKRFVMRSNDTCLLFTDHGRQPLNQLMSHQEIEAIIHEVLPKELNDEFAQSGAFIFPYESPKGELTIGVNRHDGRLEVTVGLPGESVVEAIAHEEAPPPPPAAAVVSAAKPEAAPAPASASATQSPAVVAPAPAAAIPTIVPQPMPSPVVLPVPPKAQYPHEYLSDLVRLALKRNASDIHLRAGAPARLRILGVIEELNVGGILTWDQLHSALYDFIPARLQPVWLEKGNIEFVVDFEEQARLRCHIFHEHIGCGASFRILPSPVPAPDVLTLPPPIVNLKRATEGLVVISGPRSSGRSTTLAAVLSVIGSERRAHIVTIESPIEFLLHDSLALITQVEIPTHVATFADAVRGLMAKDADICAVTDLSDDETFAEVLRAAECGILVFCVLPLPDVLAVVEYLIARLMTGQRSQACQRLSRLLRGIACQRMCPLKDEGRIPIFEVLSASPAVASLIRDDSLGELRNMMVGASDEMTTFNEELLRYVQEKRVTPQDAIRHSIEREALRSLFTRNGISV